MLSTILCAGLARSISECRVAVVLLSDDWACGAAHAREREELEARPSASCFLLASALKRYGVISFRRYRRR